MSTANERVITEYNGIKYLDDRLLINEKLLSIHRRVLSVVYNNEEYINVNRYDNAMIVPKVVENDNDLHLEQHELYGANSLKCVFINKKFLKPKIHKKGVHQLKSKYEDDFEPIIEYLVGTSWHDRNRTYNLSAWNGYSFLINDDKTVDLLNNKKFNLKNTVEHKYEVVCVLNTDSPFKFNKHDCKILKSIC